VLDTNNDGAGQNRRVDPRVEVIGRRSVTLEEDVWLMRLTDCWRRWVSIVTPGDVADAAGGEDVVVVAGIAVGNDRVLVGVGLHDGERNGADGLFATDRHGGKADVTKVRSSLSVRMRSSD
jgi:hypothetical protein